MGDYMQRLGQHPGVAPALAFTVMFCLAAAMGGGSAAQWVMAAGLSSLMWATVLWTARTQPLPEREAEGDAE